MIEHPILANCNTSFALAPTPGGPTDAVSEHPILANCSTSFTLATAARATNHVTWVRFKNERILPVDTVTGRFVALIDRARLDAEGVNKDGMWHQAMVLSYALCGDEMEFEQAIDEVAYTADLRSMGGGLYLVEATFPRWNERDQLDWCELFTTEQLHGLDSVQLADGLGVRMAELPQVLGAVGNDYGEECVIALVSGREIRCPASPTDCSYVRITAPAIVPLELGYWSSDEWGEAPAEVMGAILGAAHG